MFMCKMPPSQLVGKECIAILILVEKRIILNSHNPSSLSPHNHNKQMKPEKNVEKRVSLETIMTH